MRISDGSSDGCSSDLNNSASRWPHRWPASPAMPTSKAWSSSFASGPASRSPRTGCRLFDAAHADDAEAGVHVGHLAGDAGRQVRAQEGRGIADVLDGDRKSVV